MGIFVNRGNQSFARTRKSQIYIDKSGLLKYTNSVIDTEQCLICSSRPRRFGKTMAAGMLTAYYCKSCDSTNLFQGLEISESSDYTWGRYSGRICRLYRARSDAAVPDIPDGF